MSSYTKITKEEAQGILEHYFYSDLIKGPYQIEELVPLSLGISNSNYKLRTFQETFLLKISNDKNEKELSQEMLILNKLHQLKYPYSLRPFATLKNHYVYHYQNYHGVLLPFIEGIPPGPNDRTCFEIGAALGLLHKMSMGQTGKEIRSHEEVGFGPLKIFNYTQNALCPPDYKQAHGHLLPNFEEEFLAQVFPKGIIHGDLYYDNTLFDNNRLKILLDFEQAGEGEFIFDVGISISGTCLEKGFLNPMLINSYLRGYQGQRSLEEPEKKIMKKAIILGYLSISLWRIKRFKEGNLNPALRDSYRDLLEKAYYFKNFIQNDLVF